jgi:hypothetical protein
MRFGGPEKVCIGTATRVAQIQANEVRLDLPVGVLMWAGAVGKTAAAVTSLVSSLLPCFLDAGVIVTVAASQSHIATDGQVSQSILVSSLIWG